VATRDGDESRRLAAQEMFELSHQVKYSGRNYVADNPSHAGDRARLRDRVGEIPAPRYAYTAASPPKRGGHRVWTRLLLPWYARAARLTKRLQPPVSDLWRARRVTDNTPAQATPGQRRDAVEISAAGPIHGRAFVGFSDMPEHPKTAQCRVTCLRRMTLASATVNCPRPRGFRI
jgi:hypothetical protein